MGNDITYLEAESEVLASSVSASKMIDTALVAAMVDE